MNSIEMSLVWSQPRNSTTSISHQHMTPTRVNRAHWHTKENRQDFDMFCIFPVHGENGLRWPQMMPRGFFLLIQTLPTFWAERILILRFLYFFDFLDPTFLDFQVSRSPNFWVSRSPDLQIPRFPDSQISRRRRRLRRRRTNSQIPT